MRQQLHPILEPTVCNDHTRVHKTQAKLQGVYVGNYISLTLNGQGKQLINTSDV